MTNLWKGKVNEKIITEAWDVLYAGGQIQDCLAVDPSQSDFVGIVNAEKQKDGSIRVLYAVRSKKGGDLYKSEGIITSLGGIR